MTPEVQLIAVVQVLFRRWPALVSFTVQEARTSPDRGAGQFERELELADVETNPQSALAEELCDDIAIALLDLIKHEPATRELMRGRTFARAMH